MYELDVNKYTSPHHDKKTNNTEFCGDIPKDMLILPKSYKYFYDEEIKNLVDIFYKNDIEILLRFVNQCSGVQKKSFIPG